MNQQIASVKQMTTNQYQGQGEEDAEVEEEDIEEVTKITIIIFLDINNMK